MSHQAGGIGHRRPYGGGVCPYPAQQNALKPWQQHPWMIPPPANAACVCAMEDVLEVDTRPDDPRRPQVCLDETSKPWVAAPEPLPVAPGPPARVDDESERKGTADLCMVFEPLAGPQRVKVTKRRTAVDCPHLLQAWVDAHYPQAAKMVLVMDHLNTHQPVSRYEAFAPAEAQRLTERLDIHDTLKHGRWLKRAETELSVLATQCVDRRMRDPTPLIQAVAGGERRRNAAKCQVNWRVTTPDARIKLKRLYPSIQLG